MEEMSGLEQDPFSALMHELLDSETEHEIRSKSTVPSSQPSPALTRQLNPSDLPSTSLELQHNGEGAGPPFCLEAEQICPQYPPMNTNIDARWVSSCGMQQTHMQQPAMPMCTSTSCVSARGQQPMVSSTMPISMRHSQRVLPMPHASVPQQLPQRMQQMSGWPCGLPSLATYPYMQSTGDTYDSAPAHADPPACLVNMQHNPSPVASAMRPQHGMAHASALAVANAVANAAAAAAAVRATYDNSSRVLPPGSCWGAQLKGDLRECTAGFLAGRGHLKNKFCPRCRLPFVKATVHEIDGPELILYRDMPPDLAWAEVPEQWVHGGVVRLCLGKGTLVPAAGLDSASRNSRKRPRFGLISRIGNVGNTSKKASPRSSISSVSSKSYSVNESSPTDPAQADYLPPEGSSSMNTAIPPTNVASESREHSDTPLHATNIKAECAFCQLNVWLVAAYDRVKAVLQSASNSNHKLSPVQ
ncbi:MAG: hypothetical protein SGPRY_006008, partial [Prymnesium sp.]